ncbi:MAG: hypothetical protein HFJ09_01180 [Lachnospiraceae bacterium]|nr:hypothetical protein [Lachnospiraceae bacterium]
MEVEMPVFDHVYDFKVEQREKVGKVLFDMITKICQKENCNLEGDEEKVLLWNVEQKKILPRDWTIEECGIQNGTRLLLI